MFSDFMSQHMKLASLHSQYSRLTVFDLTTGKRDEGTIEAKQLSFSQRFYKRKQCARNQQWSENLTRLNPGSLCVIRYSDSGKGARFGQTSQQRGLNLPMDASYSAVLSTLKSYKSRRVALSVLGAESVAFVISSTKHFPFPFKPRTLLAYAHHITL